jgi:O-methyltransferase
VTTATEERHTLLQKAALIPRYLEQKQGNPWDLLPRRRDLRQPSEYLEGARLHHRLLREGYTMTSSRRGRALHRLARQLDADGVEGAFVDCGVWNGGSTILLSNASPGREVWAFDSFEGLPEADPEVDGEESRDWTGECLGAEDKLREGFSRYASPERLHVVKGWFQDTFPTARDEVGPVALLHVDGDWYESVLLTLRTFYDRIPSGGYIVLDDYGHWIGAERATDEFRREVGDSTPMVAVDYAGRYWRKP